MRVPNELRTVWVFNTQIDPQAFGVRISPGIAAV